MQKAILHSQTRCHQHEAVITLERRIAAICASPFDCELSILLFKELCLLDCRSGDPVRLLVVLLVGMASALLLSGCAAVLEATEDVLEMTVLLGVLC